MNDKKVTGKIRFRTCDVPHNTSGPELAVAHESPEVGPTSAAALRDQQLVCGTNRLPGPVTRNTSVLLNIDCGSSSVAGPGRGVMSRHTDT